MLAKSNSVILVPIHVGDIQKEYAELYFDTFHKEFTKYFDQKLRVSSLEKSHLQLKEVAYQNNDDCTWLEAIEIGKAESADAVVGILLDDSDTPGRLIEIIKIVRPSNGKILANDTFSMKPKTQYRFKQELKAINKAWKH